MEEGGGKKKKKEKSTIVGGSQHLTAEAPLSAAAVGLHQELLKWAFFSPLVLHIIKTVIFPEQAYGNHFTTAGQHNFDRRTKGHVNHKLSIL